MEMNSTNRLDHSVINAHYAMDRAVDLFRGLGFTVTPRGYHTLGSINHLSVFGNDYLELIGMPQGEISPIREICDAPLGIHGMVFRSDDIDLTHRHLQSLGFDGEPPKSFSRPVDVQDGQRDAKFHTVATRDDVFPGGGVYYCEHHTPELVWRPEWQHHANGVTGIGEFVVVSSVPECEAGKFASLLNGVVEAEDSDTFIVAYLGGQLAVVSDDAYRSRYGSLALELGVRASMFGALVFTSNDLEALNKLLIEMPAGIEAYRGSERTVVRFKAFNTLLEFVPDKGCF